MRHINADELKTLLQQKKNLALIDVLPETDFKKGHIPGSKNLPVSRGDFETKIQKEFGNKAQPVVVYCASKTCPAAPTAAQKLEKLGYQNVYDFDGGMEEWKQKGNPIEAR
ncbi:MAG: rhodanese-like domain-containing protein [Deltaproteobacteria bacterium]|nr:rhodanese-like domain-containing protein [Deltaproteobacteria bacterium]